MIFQKYSAVFLASYCTKTIKNNAGEFAYRHLKDEILFSKVLAKQDMFAHKLVAATNRKKTATRDFFDAWFFFKQGWQINEDIVRLRTGKEVKDYLVDMREFIEKNLTSRTILQGIGELINEKQKAWVKNKLKSELIGIIEFYIANKLI